LRYQPPQEQAVKPTIATVISNPDTHEKYAISDLNVMPKVAVLEPKLTKNLPKFFASTTGMDGV